MALIITFALLAGLGGLLVMFWALSNGQYDDPEGDANRILLDDDLSG